MRTGRFAAARPHRGVIHAGCELFQTDTADFADIILPAASFLEFDDLVASYFNLTIAPQTKAQEPIGESLPNQEIFRRLSRAMEYEDAELYESVGPFWIIYSAESRAWATSSS